AELVFDGLTAILHAVDRRLRLLDAHAKLEWFWHHRHTTAQQHRVGVAGAVADRQQHHVRGKIAGRRVQAAYAAVGQVDVLDAAGEAQLAAQGFDAPPDGLDDRRQA